VGHGYSGSNQQNNKHYATGDFGQAGGQIVCKDLTMNDLQIIKRFFAVFGGIEGPWKGLIPFKLGLGLLMNPQKQLPVELNPAGAG
jgi:hypothetical protein